MSYSKNRPDRLLLKSPEVLEIVDNLLSNSSPRCRLTDVQSIVLRDTWDGKSYQQIADDFGYQVDYIKQIGSNLWRMLSTAMADKVSKKNLHSVMRRYQVSHSIALHSSSDNVPTGIQDWGEVMDVSLFYGRQAELTKVEKWIVWDRCRLVGLYGLGGIGKTAFATKLAQKLESQFDYIIWRSLRQAPLPQILVADILTVLLGGAASGEKSLAMLMEQLHQKRCLLLLDNVESILQDGDRAGQCRPGYEAYQQLFDRVADEDHQSCLLITSREKPQGLEQREGEALPVRSVLLPGLGSREGQQILADKGLVAASADRDQLIHHFGGNPLALKIAATTIQNLFGGDLSEFLAQGSTVFSDLWDLLDRQFHRIPALQRSLMYWLAIDREGRRVRELQMSLVPPVPMREVLAALEALHQRSLLESSKTGLTQQPAVMEYVTAQLIEETTQEIINGDLRYLRSHALLQTQVADYIRDIQSRLILKPLIEQLMLEFGNQSQLEQHLYDLLVKLRWESPDITGYAAGNILNLYCYLGTDLTGFDLSDLAIRQAYLAKTALNRVNLQAAHISQTTFAETFGGVVGVAFSPNGRRLATGDTKGEVCLWDTLTGEQVSRYGHNRSWVWDVDFSPNGKYLASAAEDFLVRLWDTDTHQCVYTYEGHTYSVDCVAFSPNGRLLASCGQDATIRLWRSLPGSLPPAIRTLVGHTGRVWYLAFSPDGRTIASGSEDLTIRLWDVQTGACLAHWPAHSHWVRSIAFCPNGRWLASGSYDQTIKIWDVASQACLHTLIGHRQPVSQVKFSPDGRQLASSSFDQTVRVWDLNSGLLLRTLTGHTSRIWAVTYHPDGNQLASGGDDHATKFWELPTGHCTKTIKGHTNALLSIDISPDGCYLAGGYEDQTVKLWEIQSGQLMRTLPSHQNRVWGVAFRSSLDEPLLASSSADYTIKLWNWQTGDLLATLAGHKSWVWRSVFSPAGYQLASASYDQTVKLWDVRSPECLQTYQGHTSSVVCVNFSPDGRLLVSSEFSGTIKLWDIATGECLQTLAEHASMVWTAIFSDDGAEILSCSYDGSIKRWSVQTGQCLQTITGHEGAVSLVRYSPDRQSIYSGGFDRTMKQWDIQSGQCLRTFVGHKDVISGIILADNLVFTSSFDETIKCWNLATGEIEQSLQAARPYERMNIAGVQGLSDNQKSTLKALGAIE